VSGHPDRSWGLRHARAVWNNIRAGQPALTAGRGDVVVKVVHQPAASWVGLTTWSSACHATVELNASTAQGYGSHTGALRRWTTVHELGHVLGLTHTSERSVMNPHASLWMNGGRTYAADVHHLRGLY
jgi:predicted Zn-dependent protease